MSFGLIKVASESESVTQKSFGTNTFIFCLFIFLLWQDPTVSLCSSSCLGIWRSTFFCLQMREPELCVCTHSFSEGYEDSVFSGRIEQRVVCQLELLTQELDLSLPPLLPFLEAVLCSPGVGFTVPSLASWVWCVLLPYPFAFPLHSRSVGTCTVKGSFPQATRENDSFLMFCYWVGVGGF